MADRRLPLRRDRQFALLFAGQTLSMFGDSVILLMLAIWVKDLTGSNGAAGAVMLTIAAPALVAPLFGAGVDRVRRKPFLIWTNVGSALAVLPLLAVSDRADVWIVYAVGALYGVSFVLLGAGLAGLLKAMLPDEQLAAANGALRTSREGLRLIGPLFGAGLYATVGPAVVAVIDAVSFLLAAAVIAALRVQQEPPERGHGSWASEATAGLRQLFGVPALRQGTLGVAAALLLFGMMESGAFAYVDEGLGRPATFVGVLVTAMGVGSIAGGLLAAPLIGRTGELAALAIGLALLGAGLTCGMVPLVGVAFVGMPVIGAGLALVVVAYATLSQRRTPQALQGRVSTAKDLVIGVPQTVSIALGAVLVSVVDYRWLFATASIGVLATALALWRVREPVRKPAPAPAPDAPLPARSTGWSARNRPESAPSARSGCRR